MDTDVRIVKTPARIELRYSPLSAAAYFLAAAGLRTASPTIEAGDPAEDEIVVDGAMTAVSVQGATTSRGRHVFLLEDENTGGSDQEARYFIVRVEAGQWTPDQFAYTLPSAQENEWLMLEPVLATYQAY